MEYDKQIIFLEPGDAIEGFYLLKQASVRQTTGGRPFLNATLADASGTIDCKMWDYTGAIGTAEEGKVVKIRGEVSDYRGTKQLTIQKIRLARTDDSYDLNDLVATAPIDSFRELEYIHDLIASFNDGEYREIAERMLDRHIVSFSRLPAAKSIHHSFVSGLLMHTANMLRIADFLSTNIYPETVDRSLLLTGTLLHDLAKEREFVVSELGAVTEVSVDGALLGHLTMGAEEIGSVAAELGISHEKTVLLQHMILSHHGQPEFGACVRPATAEAELLSLIDLLDSRMEIYAEAYDKMEEGTFSDKIYALDKRIYRHGR